MNCIDCSYSLLKDGHSKCTYEEGECIKISWLEKENAELKEDLRNKKLAIQNRNGRIKELEEENAELKKVAEFQQSSNMSRHFENKKLKEVLAVGSTFNKALNSMNKSL